MAHRFSAIKQAFLFVCCLTVFLGLFAGHATAQVAIESDKPIGKVNTDTIIKLRHSPKRAALLSTIMPGLGQAYNKKYWKIPVLYAGLGTSIYFIISNATQYNKFHKAYVEVANGTPQGSDDFHGLYSVSQLQVATDYYRRNRDLSYAITAGIYALNIIDATVDAHLFFFDISDELSIHITPTWFNTAILNTEKNGYIAGLSLTLLVIK